MISVASLSKVPGFLPKAKVVLISYSVTVKSGSSKFKRKKKEWLTKAKAISKATF